MVYLLASIIGMIKNKGRNSISFYLFFLLFLSSVSAFLVGREHDYGLFSLWCVLFNAVLLYINFNGFCRFKGSVSFVPRINENRLALVEIVTTILALIVIIADAYILYKVMFLLVGEMVNVQEFKNEGGAADVYATLVPGWIIGLSYLISPLGYLFITLHFYYLLLNKKLKALKYFLLSLILILSGLMTLSRSATVSFILIYSSILFFCFPLIEKKFRGQLLRALFISGIAIGGLLFVISESRFSERYTTDAKRQPLLDERENPLLFSTLDYFAQWQEHGIILMGKYSPEKLFFGFYNSSGLGIFIRQRIEGTQKVNQELASRIEKNIGETASAFHGPIPRLIFDFGYIGTVVFILILLNTTLYISPKNKQMYFHSLLFLPILVAFPLGFFAGNSFGVMTYDIAIIYNIVIYLFIKSHCKRSYPNIELKDKTINISNKQ